MSAIDELKAKLKRADRRESDDDPKRESARPPATDTVTDADKLPDNWGPKLVEYDRGDPDP